MFWYDEYEVEYVPSSLFAEWFANSAAIDMAIRTIEAPDITVNGKKMLDGVQGVKLQLPKVRPKTNTARNARRERFTNGHHKSRNNLIEWWQAIIRKAQFTPSFENLNKIDVPEVEPKPNQGISSQYNMGVAWQYGRANEWHQQLIAHRDADLRNNLFVGVEPRKDNEPDPFKNLRFDNENDRYYNLRADNENEEEAPKKEIA